MATKKALVVTNPRRGGKRRRRRNGGAARNPLVRTNAGGSGLMAAFKAAAPTAGGGGLGGFVVGFADAKFLADKPMVSILFKLGVAVASIGLLGKGSPNFAAGLAGGAIGGLGYSVGVKLGGGMVARNRAEALQGLGAMADEDDGKLADIVEQSGLGDVVEQVSGDDELAGGEGELGDVTDDDVYASN